LDEFPQLLNVLKGELSLVGPRPHEPEEVACYPEKYKHLPQARAGVTGLSQISGASSLPFLKELELDAAYLSSVSWRLDMKIIFKTLLIIFFDPHAV
jgi:lipopolysaccharide/colanic/teichoic acid biosynthesis glycosyltransferase